MLRKILIYSGYILLTGIFSAYFIFSTKIVTRENEQAVCQDIRIAILDSVRNRFVSKIEILDILRSAGITVNESKIKDVNQYRLENLLNNKTAIRNSQVSVTKNGILFIDITQRRPVLRIETKNGGFYMDDTAYIFPLMTSFTSYVPVVTGHIPFDIPSGYRGELDENNKSWKQILELGLCLERKQYWNEIIEQIYIDEKGVLYFTSKVGMIDIIFGQPDNLEYKFRKLQAFYEKVIPDRGWDTYRSVDLSFSNQLVCKKNNNKPKI